MVIVRHKNLNAIVLKEVFQAGLNQMKKYFWPVEIKSFFETRGTHSCRVPYFPWAYSNVRVNCFPPLQPDPSDLAVDTHTQSRVRSLNYPG